MNPTPKPGDRFVLIGTITREASRSDVIIGPDGVGSCLSWVQGKFWATLPGIEKSILICTDQYNAQDFFDAADLLRDKLPTLFQKP
jgi:hypothetical protein